MNSRVPRPRRLTDAEMESLISELRKSERQSDRDVAAELDAYRGVSRRAA